MVTLDTLWAVSLRGKIDSLKNLSTAKRNIPGHFPNLSIIIYIAF